MVVSAFYRYREAARLRMQSVRKRTAEAKGDHQYSKQSMTEGEKQSKKNLQEYWRVKQQESRRRRSTQKKTAVNRKRRQDYADKKKGRVEASGTDHAMRKNGSLSTEARKKSIYRYMAAVRDRLPDDPELFASVLREVVGKASPRKKRALAAAGAYVSYADGLAKKAVNDLRGKQDPKSKLARRHLVTSSISAAIGKRSITSLSRSIGVRWHYLKSCMNSDSTEEDTIRSLDENHETTLRKKASEAVENYYQRESTELPETKLVSKKTGKEKRVLDRPLTELHEDFRKEHPETSVAFSTFAAKRPQNVVPLAKSKMIGCLCEYCENVNLKVAVLNKETKASGQSDCVLKNKYDLVATTMCTKGEEEYHASACIRRECDRCGVNLLREKLQPVMDGKEVEWLMWKNVKHTNDGKTVTKKEQVTEKGTRRCMVEQLIEEAEPLAQHLFTSKWQYRQFLGLQQNIKKGSAIQVLDFAQNYRCEYQDEVQSAHYSYRQITVHPIVTYYPCDKCEEVVREDMVFLTDDLQHNADAVEEFTVKSVQHLTDVRRVSVDHLVQFTDGSPTQYKSKISFFHLSKRRGFSMERNYFGSRHGKGPADGCSAVVKSKVRRAVLGKRARIQNAQQMYDYCVEHMVIDSRGPDCCHARRVFFLIETIPKTDRNQTNLKPVTGTRKIHQVRSTGVEGQVAVRNLSCHCEGCQQDGNISTCTNGSYVEESRMVSVLKVPRRSGRSETSQAEEIEVAEQEEPTARSSEVATEASLPEEMPAPSGEPDELTDETVLGLQVNLSMSNACEEDIEDVATGRGNRKGRKRKVSQVNEREKKRAKKSRLVQENQSDGVSEENPSNDCEDDTEEGVATRSGNRNRRKRKISQGKMKEKKRTKKPRPLQGNRPDGGSGENGRGELSQPKKPVPNDGGERRRYFQDVLRQMSRKTSFGELQVYITTLDFISTDVTARQRSITEGKHTLDAVSLELYPDDVPEPGSAYLPVLNLGDGNCLAHCGALYADVSHEEMRARIVAELVLHEECYLDPEYLRSGVNLSNREAANLLPAFTMYSDEYRAGDHITPVVTQRVYREEVLNATNLGQYMGIWQIFAMASVLQALVFSVYPQKGNPSVRKHLHRLIYPRRRATEDTFVIMWTSTREHLRQWMPNHFVPVLPMQNRHDAVGHLAVEKTEMSTGSLIKDISEEEWERLLSGDMERSVQPLGLLIEVDEHC